MKTYIMLSIAVVCIVAFVSAADVPDISRTAQLTVTDVTLNPEVFYEGDTGTITVSVMNTGIEPISANRASLNDNSIRVLRNLYESVGSIGAQNRMNFTFTVKADTYEGIYYPLFYLDFRDAGQLRYPVKLVVSNTPLKVGILEKPDNFSKGRKEEIKVFVGNPRDNTVTGVTIIPECEGAEITPTASLIGSLPPNTQLVTSFLVTPEQSSLLKIKVQYQNGINVHEQDLVIPVKIEGGKKESDPFLTNIQIRPDGDIYRITGDVTNAGLEDSKGVVITVGSPAVPVDPYRSYVVGSLKPDDFASFEVTFKADKQPSVPLIVNYKDLDGNPFQKNVSVETGDAFTILPTTAASALPLPLLGLIVVIGLLIALVIYRSWQVT